MGGREARHHWEHVGLMMLMGGFLLAPLAWFLDLQVSYAMTKWACENDRRDLILLLPLGSLALIAAGTWLSWACWTRLRDDTGDAGGATLENRSYFLALAGLAMNGVFGLLILTSYAPRYFLSPCE